MPPSGSAAAPRPQRPGPGRGRRILRCRHRRHRRTARGPHGEAGGPGPGGGRDARDQAAQPRKAMRRRLTRRPPDLSTQPQASFPLAFFCRRPCLGSSSLRKPPASFPSPLPLAPPFASDLVRAQVVCALRVWSRGQTACRDAVPRRQCCNQMGSIRGCWLHCCSRMGHRHRFQASTYFSPSTASRKKGPPSNLMF